MDWRTSCALGVLIALCGCATERFTPLPNGAPVTLSVAMSPQSDGIVKVRNTAVGDNALNGAGTGGLAGGLWGLTCGPWAVLCVPLGAVAGVVAGTAAGAAVGTTGALSDDKVAQLRSRLERIQQAHPPLAELTRNVNERALKVWTPGTDASAPVVRIELQDLQLASTRDERVRCEVRVRVVVENRADKAAPPKEKVYDYVGPFSSLAVWLDENSDFVDTSLTSASHQIAAQIISDLTVH